MLGIDAESEKALLDAVNCVKKGDKIKKVLHLHLNRMRKSNKEDNNMHDRFEKLVLSKINSEHEEMKEDISIDEEIKVWLKGNKLSELISRFAEDGMTLEELSKFKLDEIDGFAKELRCKTILRVRLRTAMIKLIEQ